MRAYDRQGRTESEAILAVQTGILQLVFSTELATILDMCSNLQSIVEQGENKKPH